MARMARALLAAAALLAALSLSHAVEVPLRFGLIMRTGDAPGESTPFGQLLVADGSPVLLQDVEAGTVSTDVDISNNPDFSSLHQTPDGKLYLITQFESPLPSPIYVVELEQDKETGQLTPISSKPVNLTSLGGGWNMCAGQVTPWGTHIGGEEYEPDARLVEIATSINGSEPTSLLSLDEEDLYPQVTQFMRWYGEYAAEGVSMDEVRAVFNPYMFGQAIEVSVGEGGAVQAQKWYTMGREAKELVFVMPDNRTAYITDDGTNVGFFKFVADAAGDLSSGTLYAAKFNQTSDVDGGAFDISWIELGSATQDELVAEAQNLKFSDIMEYAEPAEDGTCPGGFTSINAGPRTQECLKLKDGMDKWAAFFETRRYAALKGATTEFSKWEGLTFSPSHSKIYTSMTDIRYGMEDFKKKGENDSTYDIGGNNDVRLPYNKCGCVYQLDVDESYNALGMSALFCGTTEGGDDDNACSVDSIASPDNISIMDGQNTLIIGEDTSNHQNDMVWAYNLDSGELTRIASAPYGSETTSVYFYPNIGGFAYIMGAVQHPYGESDEDKVDNPYSEGTSGYVGYWVVKAADIAGKSIQFGEHPVPTTDEAKSTFMGTTTLTVA